MISQVKPALAAGHTLTVQQSAIIAQRSPSWIRDRIHAGGLRATWNDRRMMVDAASLKRLLIRLASRRSPAAAPKASHLRLVINNPVRSKN